MSVLTEENVRHFGRAAEVFILKRVTAWVNFVPTDDEKSRFHKLYQEFFTGLNPLLSWNDDFKMYMLVASSMTAQSDLKDLVSNVDISSISVNRQIYQNSTATVVLQNPNKKYLFQNDLLQKGKCVISSNDMIIIRLPDWQGNLNIVFTGYVNTVSWTDVGINNVIKIECEDILKRLRESRVNVTPSTNIDEAIVPISPYSLPWANQPPHDVVSSILTRTYSDFNTISGWASQMTSIENANTGNPAQAAQEKLDAQMSALANFLTIDTDRTITDENGNVYHIPNKIIGYKTATSVAPETSTFEVTGTFQPAYAIAIKNGSPNIWQSEWRSMLDIVRGIAEPFTFEFFADAIGFIHFRPMNVTFQNLLDTTSIYRLKSTDTPYIIDVNHTDSDLGIVTIMYTKGDYSWENIWSENLVGPAVDGRLLTRFGPRVGPQLTRIGLLSPEACGRYSRAYLDRINRQSKRAEINLIGNSNFAPGNPVWLEEHNVIYYITSVSHNFVAGDTYTVSLNCDYGRRPVCWDETTTRGKALGLTGPAALTEALMNPTTLPEIKSFNDWLNSLIDRKEITTRYMVGSGEINEIDYFKSIQDQLRFNDMCWEPLSDMDYVDIINGLTSVFTITKNKKKSAEQWLDSLSMNGSYLTARNASRLAELNNFTVF